MGRPAFGYCVIVKVPTHFAEPPEGVDVTVAMMAKQQLGGGEGGEGGEGGGNGDGGGGGDGAHVTLYPKLVSHWLFSQRDQPLDAAGHDCKGAPTKYVDAVKTGGVEVMWLQSHALEPK